MKIKLVFHSRKLMTAFLISFSLLIMGLLTFVGLGLKAHAALPDLPDELRAGTTGKMVFVDFYSPMCGACLMMEPHLDKLKAKTADKIDFRRVDITRNGNEKYLERFAINSTPIYMLFDGGGKPIYRMEAAVTPAILEKQILRSTGQLQGVGFPKAIPLPSQSAKPQLKDMILVSFEKADCTACKTMTPYLNGFELTGQEGLHVVHVNADTPEGKQMMSSLKLQKFPSYLLLDNSTAMDGGSDQRGELFRVEGEIQPKVLWNVIRLFGQAGV